MSGIQPERGGSDLEPLPETVRRRVGSVDPLPEATAAGQGNTGRPQPLARQAAR